MTLTSSARGTIKCLLTASLFLVTAVSLSAQTSLWMPSVFGDHMVLQQGRTIPIWGKAPARTPITVTLGDQTARTTALSDGTWRAELPVMSAGGPYTLEVAGAGGASFSDVWVGEVWVASGQSNMQWSVAQAKNPANEIAQANHPKLRMFSVNRTTSFTDQDDVTTNTGWQVTTPENVPGFSAVGYFFGRKLVRDLDVPVGIIHTSWGGTPAEAWTSATGLASLPEHAANAKQLLADPTAFDARMKRDAETFDKRMAGWLRGLRDNDPGFKGAADWTQPDLNVARWKSATLPGAWESDLGNYDGVVWYRKEFDLNANQLRQDGMLTLGPIDDSDETWVNGVEIGNTNQYNLPREYTVPKSALKTGRNVIVVRVTDTGGGGGFTGQPDQMKFTPGGWKPIELAGAWKMNMGSKIDPATRPRGAAGAQHEPTALYNAMIEPLIPYRIKGAIWYQGESNADRAYQYRTLFPTMIQDWRTQWGQGDFPFYYVQLANYLKEQDDPAEKETWPELREAQNMALALPNTGMAVITDIGEADDIHPTNKQDVGLRLAFNALAKDYNVPNVGWSGPEYQSFTVDGNEARVRFIHAGGMVGRDGPIKGFAIAGRDQVFHWADATVDGSDIVLTSSEVPHPVAVRYNWANNPIGNLYNSAGLPASPFRTDHWPFVTQ